MITENLSTLKIHKLTQAQYDRELTAGNLDESALYLTPYDASHTHAISDIINLQDELNTINSSIKQINDTLSSLTNLAEVEF